jgi:hypothetical protein
MMTCSLLDLMNLYSFDIVYLDPIKMIIKKYDIKILKIK